MKSKQQDSHHASLWKPFVALGALAVLTLGLTYGCSDSTPTGSTKQTGSTNDSSFQLVSSQLSPGQGDASGLDWIDPLMNQIPGFTASSQNNENRPFLGRRLAGTAGDTTVVVSATFVIDSISGWIVFNATITDLVDTFTVVDSMRFRDLLNSPVVPQDSLVLDSLGGVDIRVHGSATASDSTDFAGTGQIHSSITVDIIGRDLTGGGLDTVRINATESDTLNGAVLDSANGQCSFNASMNSSMTNIVGLIDDTTDACPLSGQAQVTATVSANCQNGQGSLTFNDGWTVTATFNGGVDATVVFENSTTRWEVTEPCGNTPPPAASPLHRLAGLAKASIE